MKLSTATSVFNMGDTSIRVKQLVEVNRVILSELREFSLKNLDWNPENQEKLYYSFIERIKQLEDKENTKLFTDFSRDYKPVSKDKTGLRGRTLTNALVKSGFVVDKNRALGEAAVHYLDGKLKHADDLEQLLGLDINNLFYLRQYLKLRIYAYDNNKQYFYNLRFSIALLAQYDDIPKENFFKIIESIKPGTTIKALKDIIDGYKAVSLGKQSFNSFYKNHFLQTLRPAEDIVAARKMFKEQDFSDEKFKRHFPNRKSFDKVKLYKEFVLALIKVIDYKDNAAFNSIKKLSKDSAIRKAFSGGKNPFEINSKQSVLDFLNDNASNPLLDTAHYQIYEEFVFSKHNDLIREYSDMCRRAFQVTGVIRFENDLVNLNHKWFFKPLLEIMGDRFSLNGEGESDVDYEGNLDSIWFRDKTFCEILGINKKEIDLLLDRIRTDLDVEMITDIPGVVARRQEHDFRHFVDTNFPVNKVIEILSAISTRNNPEVNTLVTDNATISTIYEYILTIAWYHISNNKDFQLHKTFQVSLDGNKLPLVHRGGGAGDIEVITENYALLLEATLMDKNTQKRGEMEPVIRHSINFKLMNWSSKRVQTLFVANELDENVMNVFRATQFVQLAGTLQDGSVNGLNIFPLKTEDIIYILKNDIKDHEILNGINDHLDKAPAYISSRWHEPILKTILGIS